MKEIICIQAGECGNKIGTDFWATLCSEHDIDYFGIYQGHSDLQLDKIGVYFREIGDDQQERYVARSIPFDLDSTTMDQIKNHSLYKHIFPNYNIMYGEYGIGCGNSWAKGHYTEGAENIDSVLYNIHKEMETCDLLQGFQISHSLGGGTGGGMGTLLISKLKEEYPKLIIQTFSVIPSPNVSHTVVEGYSTVISLHQITENADLVMIIDNEALYNICTNYLKLTNPKYGDLNHLIKIGMSGSTLPFRIAGEINTDLYSFCANMIPFPRLHFMTIGCYPLTGQGFQQFTGYPLAECI